MNHSADVCYIYSYGYPRWKEPLNIFSSTWFQTTYVFSYKFKFKFKKKKGLSKTLFSLAKTEDRWNPDKLKLEEKNSTLDTHLYV